MRTLDALHFTLALGLLFFAPATALAWSPEHEVELIAGTNPGGAADRTARTIDRLLQRTKLVAVPTVVINKPGAGGAIAWSYINQHRGDGHYLAVATPPLVTNQITGKSKLSYTDVTPVVQLFGEYFPFVVRSDSPIKTGADLLRQLRSDPASIGIAVASSGGANHIAVGLVAKKAGIDVRKLKVVVFNSGGDTLTALLGGHVQLVAANPASAASLVQSGKLRAIAVAAPKRLDGLYANVPTWREQGVDAVLMTWRGVVGPRDMDAGEIGYWEGVFHQMAQTKDWQDDLRKNFWVDNYLDSAGAKAFLREEYGQLKAVLSDLGLAK